MTRRITSLATYDLRFPTSRELDGSDAMNPDPDYSAAYVVVRTDVPDGLEGHGFAFTIGRGNDVQVAAVRALEPFVVGLPLDDTLADMGGLWRRLVHDSQLRWLGPEKGVVHMAISAVVNALWDLKAKRAGKPIWKLLSDMSPEEIVDLVDFRYLTDALTREDALEILCRAETGKAEREARMREQGYPAYTTSPGWLGYDDAKLSRLAREAVADGFRQIKLKVGVSLEDDVVFKQLLQAEAIDFLQLDAARVAGLNENVAILLLAAKFGVPVCPHAGGVGLCELVQHLSMFDYVAVSGSLKDRVIEYVDHLHEHFVDPVVVKDGCYAAPTAPGFSAQMHEASLAAHLFPDGPVWVTEQTNQHVEASDKTECKA